MRIFSTKRRIAVVGAFTALALAGGGAAFAYFTSTGSGTGSATVGSSTNWLVTPTGATGTIFPGSGSTVITYNVKNTGTGNQSYSSALATLPAETNGDAEHGGSDIAGCLAAWFDPAVTSDPGLSTSIAGGASVTVQVTVTMPDLATTNQNACQGVMPDVTLTVG
jgi:hypothetical protein